MTRSRCDDASRENESSVATIDELKMSTIKLSPVNAITATTREFTSTLEIGRAHV